MQLLEPSAGPTAIGPHQESSPTPQFKSINFLAFSFLYGPTLTFHRRLLEKPKLWRRKGQPTPVPLPGKSHGRRSLVDGVKKSQTRLSNFTHLTRRTFFGRVMSLLFNMLSRLVIPFLLRSKHLLISLLDSPHTVILEPPEIKSHCFHCFPIYLP